MTEALVNGDCENEIGWIFGSPNSSYYGSDGHSPTHSIYTYSDGVGFYQALDIPVNEVNSFTFWIKYAWGGSAGFYIIVTYTDDTHTDITVTENPASWTQVNYTASLTAGKTISEIRFWSSTGNPLIVDDFSLDYTPLVNQFTNGGGTLSFYEIIDWQESQSCSFAIRNVPLRTQGQVVQEGIYVLHVRKVSLQTRLSDDDLIILEEVYEASEMGTLSTVTGWSYTAWLRNRDITWEYAKGSDGVERPWLATLEFDVEEFEYTP